MIDTWTNNGYGEERGVGKDIWDGQDGYRSNFRKGNHFNSHYEYIGRKWNELRSDDLDGNSLTEN